ncbi:MAG: hypothetical protein CM1200mP22_19860 [Dehalococcoidia bacterium]|nr:MAG: hypothetical protein CM1200mP22_19860 [Dehalococcoidia bacterium]
MAAEHHKPTKIQASPDCGLMRLTQPIARAKLSAFSAVHKSPATNYSDTQEFPMASTDTDTENTGMTTKFQHIDVERRDHVATITLQRPDRLNALNRQMAQELHDVLDQLSGEFPEIRAVIITGAGRGFCSGADVGDMPARMAEGGDRDPNNPDPGPSITMRLAPHLREIPQPVIAAVNGVAAGAGLGIALASDIRIASESARFTSVFVKRSFGFPGCWRF